MQQAASARGAGPTAREFLNRWAGERASPRSPTRCALAGGLTTTDLAAVTRHVAPLLGDRPLGGVTLGDIARLPALLEARGLPPDASRSACRALGSALRDAMRAWPADTPAVTREVAGGDH